MSHPRHSRNIWGLLEGRTLDAREVPPPYEEPFFRRATQMHASFVKRLALHSVMEGHSGCVNAIAWNKSGTLLVSGSDDTRVNIWNYATRQLAHSVDSGHMANIFCTKFLPATGDEVVVSGAGDGEVRVHRMSRAPTAGGDRRQPQNGVVAASSSSSSSSSSSTSSCGDQTTVLRCHTRRVKKLAVEEGNPNLVWSASEDATLRQHDLRQGDSCPPHAAQECRNVLLDLRGAHKRTLSGAPHQALPLKSCAISSVCPHHLLVGGSDAFARLYDRRMLPAPTASSSHASPAKPPPPVCYYAPMHLAENAKAGLHLTHVDFSRDGREVLLSYSREHVYLLDAYTSAGSGEAMVYTADDVAARNALAPLPSAPSFPGEGKGEVPTPLPRVSRQVAVGVACRRILSRQAQECEELLEEARTAVGAAACPEGGGAARSLTHAIDCCSEVIHESRHVAGPGLLHDCLCTRAAALLQRKWANDEHMAICDCNDARALLPSSALAHRHLAQALSQLGHSREALEVARRACHLDPSCAEAAASLAFLRSQVAAEEAREKHDADGGSNGSSGSGGRSWRGRSGSPPVCSIQDLLRPRSHFQPPSGGDVTAASIIAAAAAAENGGGELGSESEEDLEDDDDEEEEEEEEDQEEGDGAGDGDSDSKDIEMDLEFVSASSQGEGEEDSEQGGSVEAPVTDGEGGSSRHGHPARAADGAGTGAGRRGKVATSSGGGGGGGLSARIRRRRSESREGRGGREKSLKAGGVGTASSSAPGRMPGRMAAHGPASARMVGGGGGGRAKAAEVAMDARQRYVGHCNTGTDIKQATFLGERGEYIASGSDDGRVFIWEKRTGRLVKMLTGDENVVNCVQGHPYDCAIATSGIDDTIKLWTPRAVVASMVAGGSAGPDTADPVQVMADNQQRMRRPRDLGMPMELLQRLRVQEGMEGGTHRIECAQS